jgi:hypothetical protein
MNHETVQVPNARRWQDGLATGWTDWIAVLVDLVVQSPRLGVVRTLDWTASGNATAGLLDKDKALDTQSHGGWGPLDPHDVTGPHGLKISLVHRRPATMLHAHELSRRRVDLQHGHPAVQHLIHETRGRRH